MLGTQAYAPPMPSLPLTANRCLPGLLPPAQILALIFVFELVELNAFFMKTILWISPEHDLNAIRLLVRGLRSNGWCVLGGGGVVWWAMLARLAVNVWAMLARVAVNGWAMPRCASAGALLAWYASG